MNVTKEQVIEYFQGVDYVGTCSCVAAMKAQRGGMSPQEALDTLCACYKKYCEMASYLERKLT